MQGRLGERRIPHRTGCDSGGHEIDVSVWRGTRKRLDLLTATEADLRKVAQAVARKTKPVRGADKIGLAAGAVLNRHKVAKHFIPARQPMI
jgi:hypothetical protein